MSAAIAGRIRPIIGQTFPLERAADAHRAIKARDVIGKTLLVI
jgi:NADPH2:quinone reductase